MKKQRIMGIVSVISGLLSAIPEKDITVAIIFVPLGLFMLISKLDITKPVEWEE